MRKASLSETDPLPFCMSTATAVARAIRTIPDFPKPGIQFKDITPVLADPTLTAEAVAALAAPFTETSATKVLGIEARGFILGPLLAQALDAGFVPVRKENKLPHTTVQASYALEYGTGVIEMHADAISREDRVLIHDDVIATGGTAAAAADLVRSAGGTVVGYSFLLELGFLNGRAKLDDGLPFHSLVHVAE